MITSGREYAFPSSLFRLGGRILKSADSKPSHLSGRLGEKFELHKGLLWQKMVGNSQLYFLKYKTGKGF